MIALDSDYSEYAGFANVDYHFTNQLRPQRRRPLQSQRPICEAQATGGLLVGPTSSVSGTSSDDVFTFAVAPKYKITDDMTLYARIAKGYRPGGPNALISPLEPNGRSAHLPIRFADQL